jgi:WD40 repeat protein
MAAEEHAHADQLEAPTRLVGHQSELRRVLEIDLEDPVERRFGDYELLECIGAGGMGAVYRARQLSLQREVALKLLAIDVAQGEVLHRRFQGEARLAGGLQHPNIVPVFEIGSRGALFYFSMGLVRGPNLQAFRRSTPELPESQIARLMRDIAEAVHYAHAMGLLHLDLKPGNVLLDGRGNPQVADFGLARRFGEAAGDSAASEFESAGTPGYMAPEQARVDAELGPATDVWGLGAILYHLMCGNAPIEVDAQGRARDWRVRPMPTGVGRSADLVAICRSCLHIDPAQRYRSARSLADDLQRFLDGREVSVRRQGSFERLRAFTRREPRTAVLSAALLLALLVGTAGMAELWRQSEHSRVLAESTLWAARREAALQSAMRGDALAGLPALVANIGEAEAAGRADETLSDRRRVALLLARSPRLLGLAPMPEQGRAAGLIGDLVLASQRDGVLRGLSVSDGSERWQVSPAFPPTPWGPSYVGRIEAAADGHHALLYASGSSGVVRPDTRHMQRIELTHGAPVPLPETYGEGASASYSSDGSRALLRSTDGTYRLWRPDPWQALGPDFVLPGIEACLPVPRSSVLACASPGYADVGVWDAANGSALELDLWPQGAELSSWAASGDGRWLALGGADGELRVLDLHTLQPRRYDEAGEGAVVDFAFDGEVLAVAHSVGGVRLLGLAQGRWLGPRLRAGGDSTTAVRLDLAGGWLAAGEGRVALWRLSDASGDRLNADSLGLLRHRGALIGLQALALDGASNRLASFGSEGDLKLWQLPTAPPQVELSVLPGQPAPQLAKTELPRDPDGAYLLEHDGAGGEVAAVADGLRLRPNGATHPIRIDLPNSVQYLLPAGSTARVLVGWIQPRPDASVEFNWRLLDSAGGRWVGPAFASQGVPEGMRLDPVGRRLALWRGRELQLFDAQTGDLGPMLSIDPELRRIGDAEFGVQADRLWVSAVGDSLLLPGRIEAWSLSADGARRERSLATASAAIRVLEARRGVLLSHGPRPELLRIDAQAQALEGFGSETSEAAAVATSAQIAVIGGRHALRLFDLRDGRALGPALSLPWPSEDALASLAITPDGSWLQARSHFGRRLNLDLRADTRAVAELTLEADALAPSALSGVRALPRWESAAPPMVEQTPDSASPTEPTPPRAALELASIANVDPGRRFQGSLLGLGITDSASWPRGRLRLLDQEFVLGPALQLAPAGQALGAERFPETSPSLALPDRAIGGIDLLITNQIATVSSGLYLHWLDAKGERLARSPLALPAAFEASPAANGDTGAPAAEVALILRSAESRMRGGGNPQLRVYRLRVPRPAVAAEAVAVQLQAPAATPLLLAVSAW